MCSIEDEARWGPFVQHDGCGQLTFTLLFQESIFSILPTACALIATALRVAYLLHQPGNKARKTAHYFIKLTTLSILAGVQLAIVVLVAIKSDLRTQASIADAVVRLSASLAFLQLSHLEHTRSYRPSDLLVGFSAFSICVDGIRLRSLWALANGTGLAALFSASVFLRIVTLLGESWDKRASLVAPYNSVSPESTAGLISLLTFWWLNPLLLKGSSSTLTLTSLFIMDDKLSPEDLSIEISKRWEPDRNQSLLWTSFKQHKQYLILGALFRLLLTVCTFAQPFLVEEVTKFGSAQGNPGKAVGAWLVVGYGFAYTGMAVATAGLGHQTNKLIIGVRGSLTMILYRSMLNMTENEAQGLESAELTLVSSDMEKIAFGLQTLHHLWASVLEMGLSVWLLQRLMRLATLGSVLFAIACVLAGAVLGASAGNSQTEWLRAIQTRVHATSSVLSSLRYIQMTALEDVVKESISKLRDIEVTISKKYRGALVWVVTISHLAAVMCPILGLTVFAVSDTVNQGSILSSSRAFSSLTAFLLLSQAVGNFVPAALGFMTAFGCFGRYTEYLRRSHGASLSSEESLDKCPINKSIDTEVRGRLLGSSASVIPLLHLPAQPTANTHVIDGKLDEKQILASAHCAEVGWKGSQAVLSSISFTIRKGQFTMIMGEANSGKSTLLKTLLGESEIRSGFLKSRIRRAALCSQKPWLVNESFMSNVIGNSEYDKTWFETVLDACGLREDIKRLPFGRNTVVGMEGLRLSGGQRTRLALARAVYSREDVLLLDNVLRGSDPETAAHILSALLGPRGILRSRGTTVVYASGNDAFRVFADHIINLNDTRPSTSGREDANSKISECQAPVEDNIERDSPSRRSSMDSNVDFSRIKDPETTRVPTDSAIYWYYLKTLGLRNTFMFALLCSIVVFGLSFPQILVAWWAAANEKQNNSRTPFYVGIYFMLGGVAILALILGARQLLLRMIPRSAIRLHESLLNKALGATLTFLTTHGSGRIINRFSQDLSIIDTDVPIGFYQTFFAALTGIAQAIFMCISFKYNAIALPFCLGVLYTVQKFYLRTARQLRILDLEGKAALLAHVSTTDLGRITIRAFGWGETYTSDTARLLDLSLRAHYLLLSVQQWLRLVLSMMVAVLALALSSISVFLGGSSTAAFIGVALTGLVSFSSSMSGLVSSWTYLETAIQAVVRIKTFTAGHEERDENKVISDVPFGWPDAGNMAFRNVSVAYEKDAPPILKDLNFTINSGERVGICGRTGSGKSSIVNSLLRCIEPSSGVIVVDGIDIASVSPQLLRSNIISMSQENFILPGTVRFNVDPSNVMAEEDMVALLEEVQLWNHVKQSGGLDSDASKCLSSASQAQLLCLARILGRRASLVIMDEATSNLDRGTANFIRSICRTKYAGSTMVIISHTLEELLQCDRVMVLSAGLIVEFDAPGNLIKQEGSTFRALFKASIL